MSKSSTTPIIRFAPGTSRGHPDRHSLLLAMAKDVERLEDQGARIKQLRLQATRSQLQVANALHVTPRAYQLWESGRGDIATENLTRLARYLGTTPDFIRYGVMKRERPQALGTADEPSQLDRIEDKLDQILAVLKEDTAADAVAAELEDLPGLLAQQDAPQKPPASARHGKKKAI